MSLITCCHASLHYLFSLLCFTVCHYAQGSPVPANCGLRGLLLAVSDSSTVVDSCLLPSISIIIIHFYLPPVLIV